MTWNKSWNRDYFHIVRTRYIARNQLSTTLKLFPDLCLRVLDEYGCKTEVTANPNPEYESEEQAHSIVIASWPRPESERAPYAYSLLPYMVEKILELTEEGDAQVAADAIGEVLNEF